jgi:hypothetical protein
MTFTCPFCGAQCRFGAVVQHPEPQCEKWKEVADEEAKKNVEAVAAAARSGRPDAEPS